MADIVSEQGRETGGRAQSRADEDPRHREQEVLRRSPWSTVLCVGLGLVSACSVSPAQFVLAPGDDAAVPASFVPIHVLPETMIGSAPDLVLSANPTSINTTALTVGGLPNPFFVRQGDYALLFANAFSVQNPVTVTGSSALIVVASGQVTILAPIVLGAMKRTPGPGAAAGSPGGGSAGQSVFIIDTHYSSGGGGASYGTLGASGGTSDGKAIPAAGNGGNRYGMSPADPLIGGSKGGDGGNAVGIAGPSGGAGGGCEHELGVVVRSRTCPDAIRTRKGLCRFIAGAAGAKNKPRWGSSPVKVVARAEVD
ncbi:MAG TPA: hypothetical protein VHN14_25880 [Kofleriaceae bacterium]|jgi:hypothetical protein|nr:hypothetical protein [Kofleriaceae bacterium]